MTSNSSYREGSGKLLEEVVVYVGTLPYVRDTPSAQTKIIELVTRLASTVALETRTKLISEIEDVFVEEANRLSFGTRAPYFGMDDVRTILQKKLGKEGSEL